VFAVDISGDVCRSTQIYLYAHVVWCGMMELNNECSANEPDGWACVGPLDRSCNGPSPVSVAVSLGLGSLTLHDERIPLYICRRDVSYALVAFDYSV